MIDLAQAPAAIWLEVAWPALVRHGRRGDGLDRDLRLAARTRRGIGPRVRRLLAEISPGPRARAAAMVAALAFVAASVPAASERWRPAVAHPPDVRVDVRHVVLIERPPPARIP